MVDQVTEGFLFATHGFLLRVIGYPAGYRQAVILNGLHREHGVVDATEFEYESKRALMLALPAVVGGMIGVVYVLIASAMRGRRETEAG